MREKISEVQWAALPKVLDAAIIAQLLGMSNQGVLARLSKGTIPAYRIGRYYVVFRDEFRAFLEDPGTKVDVLEDYPETLNTGDVHRLFERPRTVITEWFANKLLPGQKDGHYWVVRKRTLRAFLDKRSNQSKPLPTRLLVPGGDDEALVNAAHALTTPARIDIIRVLTSYGDAGARLSDILDATNAPAGSVRHHLRTLEELGVVSSGSSEPEPHGPVVHYSVNLAKLGDIFGRVFAYALS
jgi:excisionase family DNA binding protein